MAFVVARPKGKWEIRESVATDAGPRNRTLATFEVLTEDVMLKARDRATRPFDERALLARASQLGAPVALREVDRLARELLAHVADGDRPSFALTDELLGALPSKSHRPEGATWVRGSPEVRGQVVADLLGSTNSFPGVWKPGPITMPRLKGRA